jgi:hypothetical protein
MGLGNKPSRLPARLRSSTAETNTFIASMRSTGSFRCSSRTIAFASCRTEHFEKCSPERRTTRPSRQPVCDRQHERSQQQFGDAAEARIRISASNEARDRNNNVSTDQTRLNRRRNANEELPVCNLAPQSSNCAAQASAVFQVRLTHARQLPPPSVHSSPLRILCLRAETSFLFRIG